MTNGIQAWRKARAAKAKSDRRRRYKPRRDVLNVSRAGNGAHAPSPGG
jgi:hypothetical protein